MIVLKTPLEIVHVTNGAFFKTTAFITADYSIVEGISAGSEFNYAIENLNERLITTSIFRRTKNNFENITFCDGAVKIFNLPNAGGNSVNSEALSFEYFNAMYGATLEATEMELKYFPLGSKITDFSVRIRNQTIGVSVTRAMKFGNALFDKEDAMRLLEKKLYGVVASTKAVIRKYRWKKQILHIWAENTQIARILEDVYYNDISDELKSNTIVVITVCENANWIFYEGKV